MRAGEPDWVIELRAIADEAAERIESTGLVGGVVLRPSVPVADRLVVEIATVRGGRSDVAWQLAVMVAPMWPTWLAVWGVDAEFVAPAWSLRSSCVDMATVAVGGLSRAEWLLRTLQT